jgi:hypothetical protein
MVMGKTDTVQKVVEYCPPPEAVIDQFARDVCTRMAQKGDAGYATPEIVTGFSTFLKVLSSAYAKYLTKHPESTGKLDN